MPGFRERLKHAWNAFNQKPTFEDLGPSYSFRPDRGGFPLIADRSIITTIYTHLSVDAAEVPLRHVRVGEDGRYMEDIDSELNSCLSVEANRDQAGTHFRQDVYGTLLTEGSVAIVPTETSLNPKNTGNYDIKSLRTGVIKDWFPRHVRVSVYNQDKGEREEIVLPKSVIAIAENPFYNIMNAENSTLKRLLRKISLLDKADEANTAGKLDIIIQLPYLVRTEARQQQAEERRKAIEQQLTGSKYGIAYTDATERITQLNRPVENTLHAQIEYLTKQLYSQLGLTEEIINGTASAEVMNNYMNRTIFPLVNSVAEAMTRRFLTKNARTRGQRVRGFSDPFKLITVTSLADIADKFTRNEVLTPNEIRGVIGIKPSDNPDSDELRNRNMPMEDSGGYPEEPPSDELLEEGGYPPEEEY